MAEDSDQLKAAETWPPPPRLPAVPKTVLVKSKEMRGLLTDFFLVDFVLGLVLGLAVFLLLFIFSDSVAEWRPHVPTPHWVTWVGWSVATFGSTLLFVFRVRRFPYLMVGFATTTLTLMVIFLLFILSF